MMKLIVYFIISHLLYTIECGRTNLNDGNSEVDVVQIISTSTGDKFVKPENPPKYFALDLNGTFYTNNEEAMDKNCKALKEVIKLGVTPFFCTGMLNNDINTRVHPGRTYHSMLYLFNNLEQDTGYNGYPGIYANGSVVYNRDGRIIRSIEFSKETLKIIYDYLEEKGLLSSTIFFSSSRSLKSTKLTNELEEKFKTARRPFPELITKEELLKENIVIFIVYTHDDLKNMSITGLTIGIDYNIVKSSNNKYEFTPPGSNKAEGLKVLMEHLGEEPSSCGYVGDNYNDVEAMRLSNLSFAVNNADDYVKREAKYVVKLSNFETAVAHIFQQVYDITL